MILKKTVFVLGAGASTPYGFPLGEVLAELVCKGISARNSEIRRAANLFSGADVRLLDRFEAEFRNSGRGSLDAFVEARREFLTAVKIGIAAVLLPLERDLALRTGERNWYRYLFSKILPGDPAAFAENKLAVITFNFDRSFERAVYLALKASYGLDDQTTCSLAKAVAVLHLHGDLGAPPWLSGAVDQDARGFGFQFEDDPNLEIVRQAASRLRIVHEEIPQAVLASVRSKLEWAERVCFLGFGYHPLNLAKLGVPTATRQRQLLGTAYRLSSGERLPVIRAFTADPPISLSPPEADVLTFLRDTEVVHD